LEAEILVANGFGIFKNKKLQDYLRACGKRTGVLTATDSDSAGLLIRNFVTGILPPGQVEHILIPPLMGKERRKAAPSKEGTLGVEGMDSKLLLSLFAPYAKSDSESDPPKSLPEPVTRADFYEAGLMGGPNSAELRLALAKSLSLPENLSTSSLLAAINRLGGLPLFLSLTARNPDVSPSEKC
jgi:ribonuclease M5